ncbi:bifunctional adenosylcobinamide kinase/adenosylcobinamide-phosphate guanylyltransferase [Clostridium cibarium]|uniref:Adenosylcobinamide kinase n=1 Tax=Clostridium cibarium TaxID=2762247 RepID=A0ABR8PXU0_9CLOT|nr:bifunctional adenosylcobinamide kinase/adenosylcobinamide-phosphate guanylyltransferase [Clostridium cibarium]MBD7912987.1 bifunctional adenosylcobinamide kinase/adenosylcobinamide-phosphate guanylyltransferase [Clostridium cibarium]
MLILITGGSGSGKSERAEEISASFKSENLIYIATMFPYDDECLKKIERHRELRKEKNFLTIEKPINLKKIEIPKNSTVLLECISNLVANEMYLEDGSKELTVSEILKGIEKLQKNSDNLIIVTNEVFSDGINYDEETQKYIKNIAEINTAIGKVADVVIEVVYSIPIFHKGEDKLCGIHLK